MSWFNRNFAITCVAFALSTVGVGTLHAQSEDGHLLPAEAGAAWEEVSKSLRPPVQPAEWNTQQPSQEEIAAFREKMATFAGVAADKAKEFYTRFPDHARAEEAKSQERRMLTAAVSLGDKSRAEALEKAGGPPQRDGAASQPADELQGKLMAAAQEAMKLQSEGMEAVFEAFEKGIREVQKEFPERPEIYQALMEVANGLGQEKAMAIAKEIEESEMAPEPMKMAAAKLSEKFARLGKPLNIRFTAVDGREIDLSDMKGQVILLDFWATWCGPCIQELPSVKEAYAKLHPEGFEIIGISFDDDKAALERLVKKEKMTWPQYFDGEGWGNKYGKQFDIRGIPAMWLIDKKGNLRDLNARGNLVAKVEKLLAE
jgi:thiol-disulfide isomerase/thioredoxin